MDTANIQKVLILCVGLPRSGKTTWARKQGFPIVCPDAIRIALHGKRFEKLAEPFVWAIAYVMARALFFSGHNTVIVDATNNTEKRRLAWIQEMGNNIKVDYKIFDTNKEECIRRAKEMNDEEIIPIIEKMAQEFEAVIE